ncbi:hypothetical protein MTR_0128s0080 [Medicago truncatula]|uniref:Uncharacterized protein n=1 Tax=Medicago truncatula TaxID=3880 RepID=A0A072TSU8_MEDTR|nr:hypothetical protein MTR_0128s0080 [Medicago truncatula]
MAANLHPPKNTLGFVYEFEGEGRGRLGKKGISVVRLFVKFLFSLQADQSFGFDYSICLI